MIETNFVEMALYPEDVIRQAKIHTLEETVSLLKHGVTYGPAYLFDPAQVQTLIRCLTLIKDSL